MTEQECKTVAEAVAVLLPVVEKDGGYEKMIETWPTANDFVIAQHHNLGRAIRNRFGFWGNPAAGQPIMDDAMKNCDIRRGKPRRFKEFEQC
jgi:hypothetical protein